MDDNDPAIQQKFWKGWETTRNASQERVPEPGLSLTFNPFWPSPCRGRTSHYSLNCQRKCCKMLALNSVSISAGNIYLIFSLCVNPFGKLGYFREDNLCREKLGRELNHLCHCEFNLQIYFPVYSICTVLVIQVQKRKYIPWLLQMRQHQTFSKSWNIRNPV